jgi:hypothetical protein
MTVPVPERITCYLNAFGYMDIPSFPPVDVPAQMTVGVNYRLVNTATGLFVRYLHPSETDPPWTDPEFSQAGYLLYYRGPFELAGAVRLAIQAKMADYYRPLYPDLVFVWYP